MADKQGYAILFLAWIVSFVLVRAIFRKTKTTCRLPPGPLPLPIIGNLHHISSLPHQAFHKLLPRYGPLIHLNLGSVPCVVASSPEAAKDCLKINDNSFCYRPCTIAIDYLTYGVADFLFAPYGPYWKFMKKLCVSDLLGGRMLNQFIPIRTEERKRLLQFILRKANASETVDVGGALSRLANNIVSRMAVSHRCSTNEEEAEEVGMLMHSLAEIAGTFNLSDFIWFCKKLDLQGFGRKMRELREKMDTMMERVIKEHLEKRKVNKETGGDGAPKDLLDILLDISQDESSEFKLTRENINSFIMNIFVAGTDTSAATTEWALAELINHPEIMKKAREEIDSVVGKGRLVEESDIANLPYLQAIVKEVLRLHPPAPLIVREANEDCTVLGYDIPAKTRLFVNVWSMGRDPNNWEKPLEFRPERFVGEDGKGQLDVRGNHFQLLPFGSGRRACPGTSLGLYMAQTTLAAMLQCFDWKVLGGDGTVDMEEAPGLTVRRAHPLICAPVARLSPFPSLE